MHKYGLYDTRIENEDCFNKPTTCRSDLPVATCYREQKHLYKSTKSLFEKEVT